MNTRLMPTFRPTPADHQVPVGAGRQAGEESHRCNHPQQCIAHDISLEGAPQRPYTHALGPDNTLSRGRPKKEPRPEPGFGVTPRVSLVRQAPVEDVAEVKVRLVVVELVRLVVGKALVADFDGVRRLGKAEAQLGADAVVLARTTVRAEHGIGS